MVRSFDKEALGPRDDDDAALLSPGGCKAAGGPAGLQPPAVGYPDDAEDPSPALAAAFLAFCASFLARFLSAAANSACVTSSVIPFAVTADSKAGDQAGAGGGRAVGLGSYYVKSECCVNTAYVRHPPRKHKIRMQRL